MTAAASPRRHSADGGPAPTVVAWDLPTRLFKWSFALLVLSAWVSSGFDDPNMTVHKASGYGVLTLIIYRILWGFFGGTTARFSSFLRSPSTVLAYLKAVRNKTERPYLGHNPAGGVMVLALLLVCGLQVALGLVASDGVLASGPFADLVGGAVSGWAAKIHAVWFYVILGLALVHIGINLYHQFVKRDNLVGAMVTGKKSAARFVDTQAPVQGSPLVALACLGVAVALVVLGVTMPGGQFFATQ